ncbi:MAG: hypothetical protein HY670_06160 [Chloroflexi bacterium]|nr:hypothetical protein [Chloroflexota bacterium]
MPVARGDGALRIGGAFTAVFAVVTGLLVLFVIPGACAFLSGLELLILGFLFIAGLAVFLIGQILHRKKRQAR